MKKNNLDEMQIQNRNRIGNQTFQLLFYLLLIDVALYGFDVRWIAYPLNIILIANLCCGIYLLRIIRSDAYVGPKQQTKRHLNTLVFLIILVIFLSVLFVILINQNILPVSIDKDNSAVVLFITSIVSIIIVTTLMLISKVQNKREESN